MIFKERNVFAWSPGDATHLFPTLPSDLVLLGVRLHAQQDEADGQALSSCSCFWEEGAGDVRHGEKKRFWWPPSLITRPRGRGQGQSSQPQPRTTRVMAHMTPATEEISDAMLATWATSLAPRAAAGAGPRARVGAARRARLCDCK
jgi:hypothetical protein